MMIFFLIREGDCDFILCNKFYENIIMDLQKKKMILNFYKRQ